MDKSFTTDFTKLPRNKRARSAQGSAACVCCGEVLAAPSSYVATDQGEYPVGPDCAKRVVKAGFEVVPA